MTRILHITTTAAWRDARRAGEYAADSLVGEGFIHCSTPEQWLSIANTRFKGRTDLVLLEIDPARVPAEIRYENLEGGTVLFPHVYGPIPVSAVVGVAPLRPGPDGLFRA